MLIACIDTATMNIDVSIGDETGMRAYCSEVGSRRHAESLIPTLDSLLKEIGAGPRDLTHVAVDVGPGLFTGLRVGVAAAKGLGLALSIPIITFSSLALLAHEALLHGLANEGERVLCAIDARRGELYAELFEIRNGQPVSALAASVGPIAQIAEMYIGTAHVIVGDPDHLLVDTGLRHASVTRPTAATMAAVLANSGVPASFDDPDRVEVVYLRDADADLPTAKPASTIAQSHASETAQSQAGAAALTPPIETAQTQRSGKAHDHE